MADRNDIDWTKLKKAAAFDNLLPVIGHRVGHQGVLTDTKLIQKWANSKEIGYPYANTVNVTRVAQFYSTFTKTRAATNENYLDFLKRELLDRAQSEGKHGEDFLTNLEREFYKKPFSYFAGQLGFPDFSARARNPLTILARLDLPLYLTTSYFPFLANAFTALKKDVFCLEYCAWYDETEESQTIFDSYDPDKDRPIIYHLNGIDERTESLVFTEDDYIDFLMKTTKWSHLIPQKIKTALGKSTLLLIGFELQDWDFRILFNGLIRSAFKRDYSPESVCIQLSPNGGDPERQEKIADYLTKYLDNYNFEIYWGDAEGFAADLWENLGDA